MQRDSRLESCSNITVTLKERGGGGGGRFGGGEAPGEV